MVHLTLPEALEESGMVKICRATYPIFTCLPNNRKVIIPKSMFFVNLVSFLLVFLLLAGCDQGTEEVEQVVDQSGESALSRRDKIRELEDNLEVAKWENARLNLKLRTVDGASLVRDKITNLWHYDVERVPFTGRAVEKYEGGSIKAEAHFLKGQKDGIERFWYRNGKLKEEGQWFDNKANGLMRMWDENGKMTNAVRYKNGDLIEILRQ